MKSISHKFQELEDRIAFLEEEVRRLQGEKNANVQFSDENSAVLLAADTSGQISSVTEATSSNNITLAPTSEQTPVAEDSVISSQLSSVTEEASSNDITLVPTLEQTPVAEDNAVPLHVFQTDTKFVKSEDSQTSSDSLSMPLYTNEQPVFNNASSNTKSIFSFLKNPKDKESLVGKYLIGALASLLVFIGAVSFIAIVWRLFSPEVKISIIGLSGLILTGIGLQMSLKKNGPIPSILLGTGSGLMYIAILSASLIFHMVEHHTGALLCTLWTMLLIFSYRYTQLFFTVIIAFIGGYVNLLFELYYTYTVSDTALILVFLTGIGLVMMFTLRHSNKYKYAIGIGCTALHFLTFFFYVSINSDSTFYGILLTAIIVIFLLKNALYHLAQKESLPPFYLILSFLASLTLTVFAFKIYGIVHLYIPFAIIFAIHFIHFFIAPYMYSRIHAILNIYYGIVMYVCLIGIHYDLLSVGCGATVLILLLILQKKVWNIKLNKIFIAGILMLDMLLILFCDDALAMLFAVTNTILLFALPIVEKESTHPKLAKNFRFIYLLLTCNVVAHQMPEWLEKTFYVHIEISSMALWSLLSALATLILYQIHYFGIESSEENSTVKNDLFEPRFIVLFITCVIFFLIPSIDAYARFISLILNIEMYDRSNVLSTHIMSLTALVFSLLQSKIIWKYRNTNKHIVIFDSIWMIARYILYPGNGVEQLLFGILHFVLLVRLLGKKSSPVHTFFTKNVTMIILLVSYFSFSKQFVQWFSFLRQMKNIAPAIGSAAAILTLFAIYRSSYFIPNQEAIFKVSDIPAKENSPKLAYHRGIYLSALILYAYGIYIINVTDEIPSKIILTLCLLAESLLQSHITFSKKEKISILLSAWTILKYLCLTWSIMHTFLHLPIESVLYSVSGLILSVGAIFVGFKINASMIRHFGLGLALLMVAKFILIDLNGENSITRVLSFIVGGLLCFLISVIYNRLSKA